MFTSYGQRTIRCRKLSRKKVDFFTKTLCVNKPQWKSQTILYWWSREIEWKNFSQKGKILKIFRNLSLALFLDLIIENKSMFSSSITKDFQSVDSFFLNKRKAGHLRRNESSSAFLHRFCTYYITRYYSVFSCLDSRFRWTLNNNNIRGKIVYENWACFPSHWAIWVFTSFARSSTEIIESSSGVDNYKNNSWAVWRVQLWSDFGTV